MSVARVCKTCGERKPERAFYVRKINDDGSERRDGTCKACRLVVAAERAAGERPESAGEYVRCRLCGGLSRPAEAERHAADHVAGLIREVRDVA